MDPIKSIQGFTSKVKKLTDLYGNGVLSESEYVNQVQDATAQAQKVITEKQQDKILHAKKVIELWGNGTILESECIDQVQDIMTEAQRI